MVAVALALGACGPGPGQPPPPSPGASATDLGLPPCGKPPSEDPNPPPPGALLPPTARMTAVRDEQPIVQLNGYVEMTPVQVREWIEAQAGIEVVRAADEHLETELLVTDGQWRTYVKARAICSSASLLAQVIAPEGSDAVLPTPAGSPAP